MHVHCVLLLKPNLYSKLEKFLLQPDWWSFRLARIKSPDTVLSPKKEKAWRLQNWGSTQEIIPTRVMVLSGSIALSFLSTSNPPIPAMRLLSERFPTEFFRVQFWLPGYPFSHEYHFLGGQSIRAMTDKAGERFLGINCRRGAMKKMGVRQSYYSVSDLGELIFCGQEQSSYSEPLGAGRGLSGVVFGEN